MRVLRGANYIKKCVGYRAGAPGGALNAASVGKNTRVVCVLYVNPYTILVAGRKFTRKKRSAGNKFFRECIFTSDVETHHEIAFH